ncbi:hypothetical protein WA026_006661 [Henosepilachna vigintioctopunctata]|uniref:cGMP-dependent protein kinase n=1 Tax=Henosepilachna vigintioctopunctata TaxID=420089 RepID=A0AAW1UAN0_9CUCU
MPLCCFSQRNKVLITVKSKDYKRTSDITYDSVYVTSTALVKVIKRPDDDIQIPRKSNSISNKDETYSNSQEIYNDPKPEFISDRNLRTFIERRGDSLKSENVYNEMSNLDQSEDQSPPRTTDVSNFSVSGNDANYIEQSARNSTDSILTDEKPSEIHRAKPRSGIIPKSVKYDAEVALVKHPKSESEAEFIREAISKNEFMGKLITGKRLDDVIDAMYLENVKPKQKIIKEGTTGTNMYVVAEGEFEVLKKGVKGQLNVIKPGEVFGELAILYNAKRLATVRSLTAAKVWVIDSNVYQQLMKKSNQEEREEIVSFLRDIQILNEASIEVLERVASLLVSETFETGKVIVREGEQGDKFYIIAAGSVTVTRKDESFTGKLHKGKCFGEKALLEDSPRQATVTADPPLVECLTLTRKQFIDHFGAIEDISKISVPPQSGNEEDNIEIEEEYLNLDLQNFKILRTLGVGGFGRVEFIQDKNNPNTTFALKYLKKYEMVQQEQQQHVINEMKIQMRCKSPFIIRMYRTFIDNKYIYFLMEVCLGGDLWSLLQNQPNKRFDERGAKFIAGCVLEALSYIHKKGFIYRDLKPENLLIASNGYIKMTDFGFAKRLEANIKTATFAGTPEYVAPEIILNRGHDKAVDYWAYGIFIYEILNGRTPFKSNDPSYMKTYNKILSGLDIVVFPPHDSTKAKHLISKLLKKNPSERLGCLENGVEDIRNHKWFADFEWKRLRECRMSSPYKPRLSSNVDFRYFDYFKKDNDIPPDESSEWDHNFS